MKDTYCTVWYWSYPKSYYFKRPWRWFRELGWNIRNAWQRTTKGYCYTDWANFDMWFKHIVPKMLREMAEHGHGYHFNSPEEWEAWLNKMAEQIEKCQDEDSENEYYQPFIDHLMKEPQTILTKEETNEEKELREKYYNRSLEIMEEQKKLFKDTMEEMLEHWDCLWD